MCDKLANLPQLLSKRSKRPEVIEEEQIWWEKWPENADLCLECGAFNQSLLLRAHTHADDRRGWALEYLEPR